MADATRGSGTGWRRFTSAVADRVGLRAARSPAGKSLHPTVKAIRDTAAEAQASQLPQMAAALAYRSIFGLIPMLVVGLVAVKQFFATEQDMTRMVTELLQYAGLAEISVEHSQAQFVGPPAPPDLGVPSGAEAPPVAAPDAPVGGGGGPSPPEAGTGSARLDHWIRDLVGRVGDIRWSTIGWIGLATLIYAAISMLVEVERAFNQIYRVPIGRSWARRITQYWTLLTLGTLCLLATFYLGEQFKTWAIRLAEQQGVLVGGRGLTVGLIGFCVTASISTLLFLLAYTTVPNTRVQIHAAIVGALVAGIGWEGGKWLFTLYLRFSASDSYFRLYGSIALIPLFMLWVYFTWLIALFGLQVAYQLQHVQRRTIAQPEEQIQPVIVDPAAILSISAALAQRFEKGESSTAAEVAARTGVVAPIAARMLDRLVESGFVHKVQRDGDERAFALARAPERIPAEDLLRLGEALAASAGDAAVTRPLEPFRSSRLDYVHGKTLAALCESNGAASAPAPPPQPPGAPAVPPTPV